LPAQGKSATCLSYRLWSRRDLEPHNGHSAIPASDRTAKIIESDESLTLSITNPLGTSDEIRIPDRMAIPPLENRKLGKKIIRCESDPILDAYLHWTASVHADELKVMAIGAVAPLFRQLIPEFEKEYGIHITATYGPTAELGEKISKGENVDVMFGAPPFRDRLVKENKIEPGIAFARSGMGIGVRKGVSRPDISTSDALRQSMLKAKSLGGLSVGIGLFTKQAIKELLPTSQLRRKLNTWGRFQQMSKNT
jgi:hypothetical protein